MNNLSWPTCILLGILLGMALVAAERGGGGEPSGAPADSSGADAPPAPESSEPVRDQRPEADGAQRPTDGSDGSDGTYTVTLTFDDGPHPTYTPRVLAVLDRHDATAVFCVVGEHVRAHPELVRRIVAEGHVLCNHTDTHDDHLGRRSREAIEREITATDAAIAAAVGSDVDVRYFRQPNTFVQPSVRSVLDDRGVEPLDWTIDPRDWSRPGSESIVQDVLNEVRPGAIVLLHDGGGDRQQTVAALEQILDGLDRAGYGTAAPGEPA